MKGCLKNLRFGIIALVFVANSHSQQPSIFWRALFVLADSIAHPTELINPNWNIYVENILPAVQVANDIYAASGMDFTRMQVAGVIRDQTNYPTKSYIDQVFELHNPNGPLKRYISLRSQYAADIIILMNLATDFGGGVTFFGPPEDSLAALLSTTFDGQVYAHEVGHIHGLGHCEGYRRSFDAQGNYVTSGAAFNHGFHTTMSYVKGTPLDRFNSPCTDFGDPNDSTQFTLTFADTALTRWNDSTQRTEILGALAIPPFTVDHIDAPLHSTNSPIIRALVNTPTNLTIADTMSLISLHDFADFLALESATIEPGFSVNNGSMRISVGSAVMTAWGVDTGREHLISKRGQLPKGLKGIENLNVNYSTASQSLLISFKTAINSRVSVSIFDVKGKLRHRFDEVQVTSGTFLRNYGLYAMPNGGYIARISLGKDNIYKQFAKK